MGICLYPCFVLQDLISLQHSLPFLARPAVCSILLPGCVWNATPRSLSPLERKLGFWTQAWMRSLGPAVTREPGRGGAWPERRKPWETEEGARNETGLRGEETQREEGLDADWLQARF